MLRTANRLSLLPSIFILLSFPFDATTTNSFVLVTVLA